VGEVLGKYHPHGDSAVYDAMARMAQDFQPALSAGGRPGQLRLGRRRQPRRHALHRSALARIAETLLQDIDKDTVDWSDNFDDSLQEPTVLPAILPNLLVNGASAASPWAWPPTSRRTTWANWPTPLSLSSTTGSGWTRSALEELMQFVKGPTSPPAA
jgi:DNA gyrase subunit A